MGKIKLYHPDDYAEIQQWFWDRDMRFPEPTDLPEEGYIVSDLAAGFLISTDTSTAILDFFITNPKASLFKRGLALNEIIDLLLRRAEQLGFYRVKCDSQIRGIQNKALSLGFRPVGSYEVYVKEI